MPLQPGARLGPYEDVALLGAGGMGEVYKARDTRLGRDVAVKVLPEIFAADPDRLERFEREARAVAALSHPGILAIHDFGQDGSRAYAVMELLEGSTLRGRLDAGPLPPRRVIDIGAQVVRALGAAHEKGIVHRDVKPENIFVTTDGRVKVLDFGLARLLPAPLASSSAGATATRVQTTDGVVLGTVGYMSPEQVRGTQADHRSDIFSFGVVFYEMLTGRRPFGGDSAVETMNAILKEDPPPLTIGDAALAPSLRRIAEHCLEKEPAERFQSARDLAFNLEALRAGSEPAGAPVITGRSHRRPAPFAPFAAAALTMAALGVGLLAGRVLWGGTHGSVTGSPSFTRLTYDSGTIWNARFAPDGQTVVYAAAWAGGPIRTQMSRADRPGSTPLTLPDASLLSMSPAGELAVSLGHAFEGWMGEGTLARAAILGGAARPVAEHVREADWTPDGSDVAIVRRVDGRERLEFPIGKVLYDTSGYISHIRFSPDGKRIAFADHPLYADDNGNLAVIDREGKKTTIGTGFQGLRGICWSPDGTEVWFTVQNLPHAGVALRAATVEGRTRTVLAMPTDFRIMDIARDGRLLIATENVSRHIEVRREGQAVPQELNLLEQSIGTAISPDGTAVLITDQGSVAGTTYATYLRRPAEPAAVRLGDGQAYTFSPDMRSVVSVINGPPSRVLLLPVGAGQSKELPNPDGLTIQGAGWMPDGKHLMMLASAGTGQSRGYIQTIDDGSMRPFTPYGVNVASVLQLPVSPDGSRVWLLGPDGLPALYPVKGGPPEPQRTMAPGEYPVGWSADGRALYVAIASGVPTRIFKIDLAAGSRTLWKALYPSQVAGVRLSSVAVTPDGRALLHSYSRLLSTLYVVGGIPSRP
jgi:WD40 repeat protein